MKKRIFYIITFLFILLFSTSNSAFAAGKQAQITASNTSYNFGRVKQGTSVEANFEIKNSGNDTLKIDKIFAACGCTAAMVSSNTIAPGEKTNLKVTFDTTGFTGKKAKTIRIFTNDPKEPSTIFTIAGEIKSDIITSIQKLNFGDLQKGQEKILKFSLATDTNSGISFSDIITRSPHIELSSSKYQDKEQNILQITVKLKNTLPVGILRERISIKSNSPLNPVVNISVFARVQGDLRINPAILSLGLIENKESAVYKLQIENKTKNQIDISSISSNNEALITELTQNDDFHWTVSIKIRENASGIINARLKVITNNPDENQKEITIPVYAIISANN